MILINLLSCFFFFFFFFFFCSSPLLYFCHHIRSRLLPHFISSSSSSSSSSFFFFWVVFVSVVFATGLQQKPNQTNQNKTKPKKQTLSTHKLQERKPWVQASCDFGNNKREER
jgi:predicted PurR-regulated permease PerM